MADARLFIQQNASRYPTLADLVGCKLSLKAIRSQEAVFLNRLGDVRDRSFENQRYRASGLNLVVAAIVLWNTVYLERAVEVLRSRGVEVSDVHLPHVSPLGWEHIGLTGDYVWKKNRRVEQGILRSMRWLHNA